MIDQCTLGSALVDQLRVGPLAPHHDGFLAVLLERGYTKSTVKEKIREMARV